uniref:Uncharacterized protein n=1 Tax=Sciurus vulgaris TaxID=55149 RepID=A0A8D2DWB7_SCIVU
MDHNTIILGDFNTPCSPLLNSMLLNDEWVKEEIKEKIKKYLEVNENTNITYQNLWDAMKAILRGKFIALSLYIKRIKRQQVNDQYYISKP